MTKRLFNYVLISIACLLLISCSQSDIEPNIEGAWIEIDNTSNQNPTGCEFNVDKESGKVTYCGFDFVQPKNVALAINRRNSKLFVEDGQFFYRENTMGLLLVPVDHDDLFFIDYEWDGEFLWIVGEDTSAKTNAINVGRVFKKKK